VQLGLLMPTLKERFKVETLGIFGSYVRGEQTEKSDLDILIEYDADASVGFFQLLELENYLTDHLGVKVDLGTKRSLKPHIREYILKETIYISPEPKHVKTERKWGKEAFVDAGEATFRE